MKTVSKILFMAALVVAASTSCQKDDFAASGRGGTKAIRITKVQSSDPVTKAGDVESTAKVVKSEGAYEFSVQRTAMPYVSDAETKAEVKTADNLDSFTLYGFLDATQIDKAPAASAADKANKNFIPGASVSKDGSVWHTDAPYYWRNMIDHYFWAQSGLGTMTADASSASFDYTGSEDVLVAYNQKYWDEDKTDELGLNFKHAMSAVKFNLGTVTYKQKNGTDAQSGRVETNKIEFVSATSGHCDVDSGLGFEWSNKGTVASKVIADGELNFAIPQNSAQMQVYFTDTYRTVTRPVMIPLDENWVPGKEYDYTVDGTVTVPTFESDVPPVDPGINLEFIGNESRSQIVVSTIDVTFYKRVTITWDVLPNVSGNGTYAMVYYGNYGPDGKDVSGIFHDKSHFTGDSDMLFIFDAKNKNVLKGQATGLNNLPTAKCQCELVIPDDMTGNVNLYFAYRGGDNGGANWKVKNLNIQVTEYKGITPMSLL